MKDRILISPSSFGQCGSEPMELLWQNDFELVLNPFNRKMKAEEVIESGRDCIGIIAGVEPLNASVLEKLPRLRCIAAAGREWTMLIWKRRGN
jgi:D-3-phosphoglycerate dehydrogenase